HLDDEDDKQHQAPAYYLEDNRYDPARQLEDSDWEDNNTERLMTAMNRLDDRSREILARRWLSEDKATLHELAAEYGVSAERIRQLEKNAMDKIKAALSVAA
ncbi:MAG: sigma-70 family RNA polymerase sigma factor, partial [Agitococcus sp.]|nr:sigma-70 family RNA polymerase sigma factor [Agitococcus sp.]